MTGGPEPYATRREFDQLAARVGSMDERGTRGIAPLVVQLSDVIKDLGKLETKLEDHERSHVTAEQQRLRDRRANLKWALGLLVVILCSNGGLVAVVLAHGH